MEHTFESGVEGVRNRRQRKTAMEESLYNAGQIEGNGTSGRERNGGIRLSGQRSGRKVPYKRVAGRWGSSFQAREPRQCDRVEKRSR